MKKAASIFVACVVILGLFSMVTQAVEPYLPILGIGIVVLVLITTAVVLLRLLFRQKVRR